MRSFRCTLCSVCHERRITYVLCLKDGGSCPILCWVGAEAPCNYPVQGEIPANRSSPHLCFHRVLGFCMMSYCLLVALWRNYASDLYLSCRTIELDLLGIVYVQEILVPDCTVAFPLTAQCCAVIIFLTLWVLTHLNMFCPRNGRLECCNKTKQQ